MQRTQGAAEDCRSVAPPTASSRMQPGPADDLRDLYCWNTIVDCRGLYHMRNSAPLSCIVTFRDEASHAQASHVAVDPSHLRDTRDGDGRTWIPCQWYSGILQPPGLQH